MDQLDSFQKWVLLCAGVLTVIYAVLRPLRKRKDPLGHAPNLSLAGQRAVEKQMTELLVELEQMARQMTAQIETRAAKLEVLIRDAEEKIAELRSLAPPSPPLGFGPLPPLQLPAPAVAGDVSPPPVPAPLDARYAEIYELSDQGCPPRVIAQKLGRPYGKIELILALRDHHHTAISA